MSLCTTEHKCSGTAVCRNVPLLYFVFNYCAAKTKYTVRPRDQHAGQNRHKKDGSKSFERVEQFKYLGTNITNLNFIHEDSKSRLKSGNACYHSEQNLLPSSSLSKYQNIQ